MGDLEDVEERTEDLIKLVDRDQDGQIELDEFKVMTLLALDEQSPEDSAADLEQLLRSIDKDNDGYVEIEELSRFFDKLGVKLDEDDIGTLVFACFGQMKTSLTPEDFSTWVHYCQRAVG